MPATKATVEATWIGVYIDCVVANIDSPEVVLNDVPFIFDPSTLAKRLTDLPTMIDTTAKVPV